MSDLQSLKNIGPELERKLTSVGISTAEELKSIGSEEAYFRMKLTYPSVCLVYLQALEGAVSDTAYNKLPEDVMKRLKAFSDNLK